MTAAAKPEYAVGDRVIVWQSGKPIRSGRVTEVKPSARGPKVTLADGSAWDVAGNCPWGGRQNASSYTVQSIGPWTGHAAELLLDRTRRRALERMLEHWSKISPEQREAIGDAARTAVREALAGGGK